MFVVSTLFDIFYIDVTLTLYYNILIIKNILIFIIFYKCAYAHLYSFLGLFYNDAQHNF